ncbi:hypothetical protein CK222_27380 [Mesorhizobium sp. WSM3866]|uniref:hypothetical protein n=1 Tax=Mesorhizobium sp. WSM3866 TaxID=422271 RepID=UPI000BAED68D|nr:hypothetical protein [Mesorhizobium sp. WSM3866]PBB40572.1 hypothetical protein CK222_27380 [Mesorhizobium sp. WSM3866]
MIAVTEDIVFCAKTGRQIVDGNVIPFPARPRPVAIPGDVAAYAQSVTIKPALAGLTVDQICDLAAAEELAALERRFAADPLPDDI